MDYGHSYTAKELETLEKRLHAKYSRAQKELKTKAYAHMQKFKEEDAKKAKELKAGTITKDEYIKWRSGKTFAQKWYSEMIDTMAQDLTNTNKIAMDMLGDHLPGIYALNRNFGAFEVESGSQMATSFTLYNENAIKRLLKDNPKLLPDPKVDIPKDLRWNKRSLNSALSQGILQGESVPKIAERLTSVTTMNEKAAVRNARTMTTSAENGGRMDAYLELERLGVKLRKVWLATLDGRTRHSHRLLDGEQIETGETFSNGLKFPGDVDGAPSEVYNCRCSLICAVKGSDLYENGLDNIDRFSRLGEQEYEEWKYGKEYSNIKKDLKKAQENLASVPNKTYSGIWKEDVTLADYESKKDAIKGKEDFYNDELYKLYLDPDYKSWLSTEEKQQRIEQYKQYLNDLKDFKENGELYLKYKKNVDDLEAQLKMLLGGKNSPFSPDAYSEARINAALRFTNPETADKYFRKILDEEWGSLAEYEKYAIYMYTRNSNPMNQPISGYNDGWTRLDFVGVGDANWSLQDAWRGDYLTETYRDAGWVEKFGKNGMRQIDYHKTIAELTLAIDKCPARDDSWVVRGSDKDGLAGLFEGDLFSFEDAQRLLNYGSAAELKKAFEGQTFKSHSFFSTGMAEGTGFGGDVKYRIYIPKGTKVVYAEPQSYYGGTISANEIYEKGKSYSYVGGEAERIIQRGTEYRVRSISKGSWGDIEIELEVVGQPDYFKYGDEETFNNGATRHKKQG